MGFGVLILGGASLVSANIRSFQNTEAIFEVHLYILYIQGERKAEKSEGNGHFIQHENILAPSLLKGSCSKVISNYKHRINS